MEDALGLPSPHELATDKEGEGEGGRGGEKEGGGTEESREDKKEVDTLAKLAESKSTHKVRVIANVLTVISHHHKRVAATIATHSLHV